jgi:O-acetylserine/cysteine efflux transporter
MAFRDFALLVLICVLWGLNMVVSKWVVGPMGVPPLFYGALRSAVIALAVLPWLLPMPQPRWRILVVGVLMGAGGFALIFVGLESASPSAAAVVGQLGVPMTTLLSVIVLGERIRWRRGLGIALAVFGVVLVMWDPQGVDVSTGLLFVAAGAFSGALGTVMMKQLEGVAPLRYQAWVGFSSLVVLAAFTAALETDQFEASMEAGWPLILMVLFSALLVSVFAHTAYYGLIHRYEANLIAPLTLMSPLMAIGFGIWLTNDHFDARMAFGTAVALTGVLIIAVRPSFSLPKAILFRNRA